jgi:hypothetical protein
MALNLVSHKPKVDPSGYTIMVYGPPGIGKSIFAVQAPNSFVIATEPGLKSMNWNGDVVTSWEGLNQLLADLAAGGHPFKTIVIDTVDNAYRMCSEYIAKKFKVDHHSDLKWGKSALLNNEVLRVLTKVASLPYGFIMTSHMKTKTIETPTGKYQKTSPNLSDGAQNTIVGMVDVLIQMNILRADDGKDYRVLKTQPSKYYDAKDRTTANLPAIIPLPNKERSYADFEEIFIKCLGGEHQESSIKENEAELQVSVKTEDEKEEE